MLEKFLSNIKKIIGGWGLLETMIVSCIVMLLPLIMTFLTIERYAFSRSTPGVQEFVVILAAYVFFLGAAMASKYNLQITVTFLDIVNLPKRIKEYADILASIFSVGICIFFTYVGVQYIQSLRSLGSRLIYPMGWPFETEAIAFPIGMALIAAYELAVLVRKVRVLRSIHSK